MSRPGSEVAAPVISVDAATQRVTERADRLATEEPLEIRVTAAQQTRTIAVTMRTPGADFELAAGFLYSEGIATEIGRISYCADVEHLNIVNVELPGLPDLAPLERNFLTTSSCGVCGKANLEALHIRGCPTVSPGPRVAPEVVVGLPDALRAAQRVFGTTGGLHAAGLFSTDGDLVAIREDVGRHNAVDKIVGWALLEGRLPLHDHIVLVSGRASFEIMQKLLTAGVPVVCAVSAPSSLAVEVAKDFGMTLIGFLRDGRFNIYAGAERVALSPRDLRERAHHEVG